MSILSEFSQQRKRSKLLKEYQTIKSLYIKTMNADSSNELAVEVVATQQGILKNNFNALAQLYGEVVQPLNHLDVSTFTNLQGSPPRVNYHKETLSSERNDLTHIQLISSIESILTLESKFDELSIRRLGLKAYKKINSKVATSIEAKITAFASRYTTNQRIIYDFIMQGTSLYQIKYRLIFIYSYFDIDDSIKLSYKKIITIPSAHMFNIPVTEVTQLIKDLAIKRSDFLIQTKDSYE